MAEEFEIATSTGQYAVTWDGPAYDGKHVTGQYAILQNPLNLNAQLLPRGFDLAPRNWAGFGPESPPIPSWYQSQGAAVSSLSVTVESATDRGFAAVGGPIPVRFIHDTRLSITLETVDDVLSSGDTITVDVGFEHAPRSGVDSDGYDIEPLSDAIWTGSPGGFSKALDTAGDERIFYTDNSGPGNGRSNWDVEGTRDFVRILMTVQLSGVVVFPQGGVRLLARLWANEVFWRKQPFTRILNERNLEIDEGHWLVRNQGEF